MTDPAIETRSLFTTPVGLAVLPDAAAINRSLAAVIARQVAVDDNAGRPEQRKDGIGQGGGRALEQVLDAATQIADRMTPGGPTQAPAWHASSDTQVLVKNQSLPVQASPGVVWTAVYIIDDGGVGERPDLGGNIEIQDPRGSEPVMYAPSLAFAVPGGETMGISQTIVPAPGLLVVYPAWLFVGVGVYRGDGKRVSLCIELTEALPLRD